MTLKRIITGILILIVCLAAFRIIYKIAGPKKALEERVIPVIVTNPKLGDIEYKVTLTGDIKAETEVNVKPRTTSRVEEIFVDEGDYVEKGARLLAFVKGISAESEIYEDMIVRAPVSGLVGMKLVKIGEQVGSSSGSPNAVFVIYGINNVKIYADVSEKDYRLVKKGTLAEIRLDAYPNEIFRGQVNNIRPVIDPLTRTTQVEIILPNSRHRIKPGMFAKVDLILQNKRNVLTLPLDAVLGETDKYVFVSQNGAAVRKPVTLGMQQGDIVEVLSGLTESDSVIIVGQRIVEDGSKIKETTGQ
ncbi:MAG: efflux RND transporter periplasmic adaptor subunit [Candidatus Margulisbacteria bacterium]|nr:efflux RND transporter periplasmic adaptor subunit [Candidatus Margulisiibacteriota bacterium]